MKTLFLSLLVIVALLTGCGDTFHTPDDVGIVDKHGTGTLLLSYWLDNSMKDVNFPKVAGDVIGAYFFVTNLELLEDSTDFWQTPRETLEIGGGDCEDLALLLASLLWSRGIESTIVIGNFDGDGHMWVEINNKVYETTSFNLPFSIDESTQLGYISKIKVLVR